MHMKTLGCKGERSKCKPSQSQKRSWKQALVWDTIKGTDNLTRCKGFSIVSSCAADQTLIRDAVISVMRGSRTRCWWSWGEAWGWECQLFRVLLLTHSLSLCTYLLYIIFFPVPLCGDQGNSLFCSVRHWGFWWGSESKESGSNGSSPSLPKIFIWVLLDKWRKRPHFHIFIFCVQLSLIYGGVPRILTGPLFPVPSSSVSTSQLTLPGPQTFSTR